MNSFEILLSGWLVLVGGGWRIASALARGLVLIQREVIKRGFSGTREVSVSGYQNWLSLRFFCGEMRLSEVVIGGNISVIGARMVIRRMPGPMGPGVAWLVVLGAVQTAVLVKCAACGGN